jgi:predicted lactoylglutathione lyase
MTTSIYINLAVSNLERTNNFFQELGFSFNPKFSNEQASCMVLNDKAAVMLLNEAFFRSFTKNEIADAHRTTEVLLAIDQPDKNSVNVFVDKAISLGAKENRDPQDHGFMFARSFHDLDGHIWEVLWMDEANFQQS